MPAAVPSANQARCALAPKTPPISFKTETIVQPSGRRSVGHCLMRSAKSPHNEFTGAALAAGEGFRPEPGGSIPLASTNHGAGSIDAPKNTPLRVAIYPEISTRYDDSTLYI